MKVAIPDDYQDCVRQLHCFASLASHEVMIFHDTVKDPAALAARLQGVQALVLTRERTRIDEALLSRLPDLRLICQTGKVSSHIDLAACRRHGVTVTEGSGTGAATAELAWALMLASRRHLLTEANRLRAGHWQSTLGQQLQGQRLGIWGYGRIGRQVALYGRAFGMRVWIWGREGSMSRARADDFELARSLNEFLADSDVLSLHVRLSAQSRAMLDDSGLARMKRDALLVNTSRAELIAPGALAHALAQGRPGWAAVDVFESEPVIGATDPLLSLPNALCTPHLGYVEHDNYERYFGIAFEQINLFERDPLAVSDVAAGAPVKP